MEKKESNAGRPSKYDPEFCEMLIEHMSKGLSYESFAALIEVHRDTLYEWEKDHPEFKEAKSIAFDKCLLFWEQQGIDGLYSTTEYENGKPVSSKSINATLWIFNMKNRFKWRDKQPDEIETVINNNNSNTSNLSDKDLDAKIQEQMNKLYGKNEP